MNNRNYVIRTMTRGEIDITIQWAADEGWNPGLHDADCFHAADPDGFLIGMLGEEPVATISVVKYGGVFGFLGFYIVKPEFRGQGYGIKIWNAGLQYLDGCVVGLDGVVVQQDNYKKSGFSLAYRNIRYQGASTGAAPEDSHIVHLAAIPFEEIHAYDRPFFPGERSEFLKRWIAMPGAKALGILDNGYLSGFGVIRPCRAGHKIGPLFADNPELAEQLFAALQAKAPEGGPVFLDTPESNAEAVALAERHGMEISFETARMYKGAAPALPIERLFGVTTFELG